MKYILTFFFLCISAILFGQKPTCKTFKDGEFKIINDSKSDWTWIKREGNLQIEKSSQSSAKIELIVEWIDECTYTLTPKDRTLKEFEWVPIGGYLIVEIIEVKANSYIQKTTCNFAEIEYISEMIKLD